MKKGAIHVDWVISIGIFIVYIIFLFVLIKPGVKESYDADSLVFILEENLKDTNTFEKGIYWEIKKTPVFVYNCTDPGEGEYDFKITASLGSGWEFNDSSSSYVIEYSTTSPPPGLGNSGLYETVWLMYHPISFPLEKTNLNLVLENCYAELGSTDDFVGVSEQRFMELMTQDLKKSFNYPKQKDFNIYLIKTDSMEYSLGSPDYKSGEQYEQANIFVKKWRDNIIDKDLNKESVVIHLEVW